MPTKDYANSRYSTLNQINASNAKNLKLAWSFSTGVLRGHEAAPVIVNNTMYLVTPYPNIVYALDLTKPNVPLKWVYHPAVDTYVESLNGAEPKSVTPARSDSLEKSPTGPPQ